MTADVVERQSGAASGSDDRVVWVVAATSLRAMIMPTANRRRTTIRQPASLLFQGWRKKLWPLTKTSVPQIVRVGVRRRGRGPPIAGRCTPDTPLGDADGIGILLCSLAKALADLDAELQVDRFAVHGSPDRTASNGELRTHANNPSESTLSIRFCLAELTEGKVNGLQRVWVADHVSPGVKDVCAAASRSLVC
ncbi:hypothetical protein [Micromonospora sp. NPDC005979]|uniref:hypothetical protein n=1 Tax=Micromonospora sp. NPDC005979 TaxID=3156726 RepID=UPI0033B3140F